MVIVIKIDDKEIHFHDSFLLLPASLRKLSQSFNVETPKSHFPYSFVKPEEAEYNGPKPDIKYYPEITDVEYNELPTNFNMKEEIYKYLNNDILSLYQVLEKFMG